MNIQNILDMYDYNYWANHLILATSAKVTPEQFAAPSSHSFGSLRGTLVHTMDAESSWLSFVQGKGFQPDLKEADFPTLATIQKRWGEEEQAMRAHLGGLHDEDLTRIISYHNDKGVLREWVVWHCLYHVVNHGMQHRSEAAALLTSYGQSPGNLDFTRFLNKR